jgi:hypothetical protein
MNQAPRKGVKIVKECDHGTFNERYVCSVPSKRGS